MSTSFIRNFILAGLLSCTTAGAFAQNEPLTRLQPESSGQDNSQHRVMEPNNVPDYAQSYFLNPTADSGNNSSTSNTPSRTPVGTPLQSDVQSTTVPGQTLLKLVLEAPVDAKTSQPGDIFEAHVADDLSVGTG